MPSIKPLETEVAKQIVDEMRHNWPRPNGESWTEGLVRYWRGVLEDLIGEIGVERTKQTWRECRRYQKFFPEYASFREYIPAPPRNKADDLTLQMAEWRDEFERNQNDPEWQKANAEFKESLRKIGLKYGCGKPINQPTDGEIRKNPNDTDGNEL